MEVFKIFTIFTKVRRKIFLLLSSEHGQSLTEYAIVAVWLLGPLFLVRFPLPISGDGIARNMIEWLFWGFNAYMEGIQFVLAMPIG